LHIKESFPLVTTYDAGMAVPDPVKSLFYRTEDQYRQFLADTETTLSLYADHGKRFTGPIWKGEWSG
jgi:hypothetical protein